MESQELIDDLRKQLDQVEAQGHAQIQVLSLRVYLVAMEKNAAVSKEHRKLEHEGMLAQYSANAQHNIEMLKAVLEAGKSALHSLLIINGGAVVALLGVMSGLAGKEGGQGLARYLALPLLEFGVGVLCGALGFAFRYFSQACYSETDVKKYGLWGDWFRYLAIFFAVAGYALFGFAIANAYNAVRWSFSP